MKQRHVPQRTCVACRHAAAKKELVRIVKTPEDVVELDRTGKKAGRGAYLCPSMDCLEKAILGRQLEKALKCRVDDDVKQRLKQEFDE